MELSHGTNIRPFEWFNEWGFEIVTDTQTITWKWSPVPAVDFRMDQHYFLLQEDVKIFILYWHQIFLHRVHSLLELVFIVYWERKSIGSHHSLGFFWAVSMRAWRNGFFKRYNCTPACAGSLGLRPFVMTSSVCCVGHVSLLRTTSVSSSAPTHQSLGRKVSGRILRPWRWNTEIQLVEFWC
jgi:hypothetical protein